MAANRQRGPHHFVLGRVVGAGAQLQGEAFGQAARAHAGGLQVLQQVQGHAEVVHQLLLLLEIMRRQRGGERFERIFQPSVVVERFDQKAQRCAVFFGQSQGQRLSVQVGL